MVVLLVALNAASYVRVEQEGETEFAPDRSTLNAGGTGTRALFDYLQQKGVDVVRWKQPMSSLTEEGEAQRPATFVIVGRTRHPVEKREADAILRWVRRGGRLVVIDRSPNPSLLPTSGSWRVGSEMFESPGPGVRPDDVEQMTRGAALIAPAQPTALTQDVKEVARSRFAGRLHVYQTAPVVGVVSGIGSSAPPPARAIQVATPTPDPDAEDDIWGEEGEEEPPASPGVGSEEEEEWEDWEDADSPAPVAHLSDGRTGEGALLVDYVYGAGRIVVLSDPYIVSNGGINRADNLFLAVGVVTGGRSARVAFDEFHQGYAATQNELFAYFRGTPILWMFAQSALVVLALVWTRSRRFARPIPAPRADRRSKLEFVASMAELQQRSRAYDLAIENIYQRTRRALARYGGLAPNAPLEKIAEQVARRSGKNRVELEALLRECEDSIAGAPLTSRRAVELARALRELERDLGILMRSREIRQAR